MNKSFKCNNCGKTIVHDGKAIYTMFCPHCNTLSSLPKEFRENNQSDKNKQYSDSLKSESYSAPFSQKTKYSTYDKNKYSKVQTSKSKVSCLVFFAVLLVFAGGAVSFLVMLKNDTSNNITIRNIVNSNDYAQEVLLFGGEGNGPGYFDDARNITVDNEGRIYVAEYGSGKVQCFNSTGGFLFQWIVDEDKFYMQRLTCNNNGNIYIVGNGKIYIYDSNNGDFLGFFRKGKNPHFENYIDDIAITSTGEIYALSRGETLIKYSRRGQIIYLIEDIISEQSNDSELNGKIAIDGMENIYILGSFNESVFKFSKDGKFINRFGSDGDEPGQFTAPYAIAIDNHGNILISDFKGIQIFSPDGRFVDVFNTPGFVYGIAVDYDNYIYCVTSEENVIKYKVR